MSVLMLALFIPIPAPVMALDLDSLKWDDLWLTNEQQASRALQADNHEQAAALSSNPARKGSAFYRQQDYQQALEQFQQLNSSDAHYNRGNTLARLGEYEEAIKAYDEALKLKPDMQDAIDNRKAIEDLLAKNQETQNSPNQDQDQDQEEQQQESQSEQNSQQQQPSEQQEESENDQSQDKPSEDSQPDNSQADNSQEQDNASSKDDTPEQSAADNNAVQTEADDTASEEQQAQQAEENSRPQSLSEQDYQAQPLTDEEEQAAQQWLRRIPDDPGDLLKRKFLYQYQNRQRQPATMQPW